MGFNFIQIQHYNKKSIGKRLFNFLNEGINRTWRK